MAKRLYNSSPHLIQRAPSTRIPLNKPRPPQRTRQAEAPGAAAATDTNQKPVPGILYRTRLVDVEEHGNWYAWRWEAREVMWGAPTPPWVWECVTDTFYAPGSLLKRHLDTLVGQERDAEDWRLVGLGKLIGRMFWVTIRDGQHPIVPYRGDFWEHGMDAITHAPGIYVEAARMRDVDAGLFDTWLEEARPKPAQEDVRECWG